MKKNHKTYAQLKDSEVEWLGAIPIHWFSTKVKYGYLITLGKMLQKTSKTSQDTLKPYLRAINIQNTGVSISEIRKMWFTPLEVQALNLQKGDVLISEGGDVGRSAIWENELPECYIQNAINRARAKKNCSTKFLFYWMNMLKQSEYIDILCNKATIAHYTAEKLENSPLFIPPIDESEKIANFLNHETAKIDTLIEKQQRLIKLIKEKRQAVISHAVTKGLDPNVPMRDSKAEGVGEVPKHWNTIPLKLVVKTRKGAAFKSTDFCDRWVRVVKASDIKQKTVLATDVFLPNFFVQEYPRALLNSGDIILSTVGSNPNVKNSAVGQIGILPSKLCGSLLNQNTVVFDPDNAKVLRKYLFYALQMKSYRDHLDLHSHGTANQSSLNIGDMLNFNINFPPIEEQRYICEYLDRQQKKLEGL